MVLTAVLLHELFNYPKGHPLSSRSGEVCAERAAAVLLANGFPEPDQPLVLACIRDHSFSKGVRPETLEGQIVQDADRLDAVGAIGIARCFATSAEMRRPFYDPADPFCSQRPPDDKRWGVDHFYTKLLRIAERMNTPTGRRMAESRIAFMRVYLEQLRSELG